MDRLCMNDTVKFKFILNLMTEYNMSAVEFNEIIKYCISIKNGVQPTVIQNFNRCEEVFIELVIRITKKMETDKWIVQKIFEKFVTSHNLSKKEMLEYKKTIMDIITECINDTTGIMHWPHPAIEIYMKIDNTFNDDSIPDTSVIGIMHDMLNTTHAPGDC